MEHWKGVVVAESFDDPTIINRYEVERVRQLDFKEI